MFCIDEIVEGIANYFGFLSDDLVYRDTKNDVSKARNYAYYVLHYEYGFSLSQISKFFDRTKRNISYQISGVKYLIKNLKEYTQEYNLLIMSINNKPITE